MYESKKKLFMGIDVGTQSARVGLCDSKGTLVATGSKGYTISYPAPGWAEQDPYDWWWSICKATRECIEKTSINPLSIEGISFDATSSTVLLVDRAGNPLERAILWMDQRAVAETNMIMETNHPVLKYVGGQDSVEWMVPKALWIKFHKPELFQRSHRIIEATDWIAFKLSGKWTASLCNATCKWNYVSVEGGWPKSFFQAIGIPEILEKWPEEVVPMGRDIGKLTKEAARDMGLPSGIPVAEGGIDAHVGLLGLNALDPLKMGLIMGSSNVMFVLRDEPVYSQNFWGPYPDAIIPDKWLIEAGQTSSGSIINWFLEFMRWIPGNNRIEKEKILAILEEEIDNIPPGSEGLVVLDYWQGNRTPRRNPKARGIIFGLTLGHSIRHLFKSIYEGISFGTRHIIESLNSHGINIQIIVAGGGGVRSKIWTQLTADICGIPILIPRYADYCCVIGAAICAACGSGLYPSLFDAACNMVSIERKVEPRGSKKIYEDSYQKYLHLYESTKHLLF